MTDFISRSDLHHIAKDLRHDAPKDNDTYFVAYEVLDYRATKIIYATEFRTETTSSMKKTAWI